jgi:dTDP-4-dehydrorhamnose reductase
MVENLVIGANGLVGRRVMRALSWRRRSCVGTFFGRPEAPLRKLDRMSHNEVRAMVDETAPKAVFDCANLGGGANRCERDRETARAFHLEATRNLARCCRDADAFLVYLSTDYVFDGSKKEPYVEEDEPRPANVYGEMKHEAEKSVRQEVSKYLVVRTTNVFGWDPATRTPNYIMNL